MYKLLQRFEQVFTLSYLFEHEQVFVEFVWIFSIFKAKLAVEIDRRGVRGLNFSVVARVIVVRPTIPRKNVK